MAKKEGSFGLGHLFNAAAIALAVDLLFVFPVSHGSIIGQFITSGSGSVVIPPLDYIATNWLGMQDPALAIAQQATQMADASSAIAAAPNALAAPEPAPAPMMVF